MLVIDFFIMLTMLALGWAVAAEAGVPSSPGCPLILAPAFPKPFLAPPAGPLPWPLGGMLTTIQWPVKVYTFNEDQQWDNQGARHLIQLCGVAEGHVSASQGLTKRGPLEKGMANHFSILALRTP